MFLLSSEGGSHTATQKWLQLTILRPQFPKCYNLQAKALFSFHQIHSSQRSKSPRSERTESAQPNCAVGRFPGPCIRPSPGRRGTHSGRRFCGSPSTPRPSLPSPLPSHVHGSHVHGSKKQTHDSAYPQSQNKAPGTLNPPETLPYRATSLSHHWCARVPLVPVCAQAWVRGGRTTACFGRGGTGV